MTAHAEHPRVPGLFHFEAALSEALCHALLAHSVELYHQLVELAQGAASQQAHIPQPEFVTSKAHNLTTTERFVRLRVPQETDQSVRCEFFPEYGSEGHALAYFRGNRHIPDFIQEHGVTRLRELLSGVGLYPSEPPQWRLTLNVYTSIQERVSGFPFHVDIPANGDITTILNIQSPARFEIVHQDGDDPVQIEMAPGDMLVLSGESRYEWKHRVLPSSAPEYRDGQITRVSLVLGLKS